MSTTEITSFDIVIHRLATKYVKIRRRQRAKIHSKDDLLHYIWRTDINDGSMRTVLLQKTGWDEAWVLHEWHRLPQRLKEDLVKLSVQELEQLEDKAFKIMQDQNAESYALFKKVEALEEPR